MTESLQQPPMPPLLTAPVLVVGERAKVLSSRAEYDVYAPDGTPLGSVHQVPGSGAGILGQLATIDDRLRRRRRDGGCADAHGQARRVWAGDALGGMLRPLAIVATICLDEVRTQKQQRR